MLRRSILSVLAAVTMVMASAIPAPAAAKPDIVPPNHKYAGKTYGEWSAKWWQWAVTVKDPLNNCADNQRGPVWFLAGVPSDTPVPVQCSVPSGKAILVPVINAEWSTNEDGDCGNSYDSLLECAAFFMDRVTQRSISIDGHPVNLGPDPQEQSRFRVQSPRPPFKIKGEGGNFVGIPAGDGRSVADGFYVLIKPLKPGSHHIIFSGTVTFDDDSTFRINTDYTVRVA